MDLLQLTVLALNLAKEHSMLAIFVFGCDKIPGALSPYFLFVYFILMIFISPSDVQGVTNSVCMQWGNIYFHPSE